MWVSILVCAAFAASNLAQRTQTVSVGDVIERAIGDSRHEYRLDESDRPALVVVFPEYANLRLLNGVDVINATDRVPGIEWMLADRNTTTLAVERLDSHPNSRYRMEVRALSPDGIEIIRKIVRANSLDRQKSQARRKAIVWLNDALTLSNWNDPALKDIHAFTMIRLAELQRRESKFDAALNTLKNALSHHDASPWSPLIRIKIGALYDHQDDYVRARNAFCSAIQSLGHTSCVLEALVTTEKHLWVADAVNRMGKTYHIEGALNRAEGWYTKARELSPPIALAQHAVIANNIGGINFHRGNYKEALVAFHLMYNVYQTIGNLHTAATARNNIAEVHRLTGHQDEAIRLLLESLTQYREEGAIHDQVATLHQIGAMYTELGAFVEAEEFLSRSVRLRLDNDIKGIEDSELLLGRVRREQGNISAAIELHNRALAHYRKIKRLPRVQLALVELAADQIRAGSLPSARRYVDEGLAISATMRDRRLMGRFRQAHATILAATEENDKALDEFDSALALHQGSGDVVGEIQTRLAVARIHKKNGCQNCALSVLAKAQKALEDARLAVADPLLRASFTGEYMDVYSEQIQLLMQQGRETEAMELAINSRTRSLLESVLYGADATISDPLRQRANVLKDRLAAKSSAKLTIERLWPGGDEFQRVIREIADLSFELNALEGQFLSRRIGSVPAVSVVQLQRLLTDADLLTAHFLGEEQGWVWYLTHDDIQVNVLPGRDVVAELTTSAIDDLRRGEFPEATDELIALITPDFTARDRIYIVPDGVTSLIPYNVIIPLTVESEVVIVPVASMFFSNHTSIRPQTALIVSDPVFGPDDTRFPNPAENHSTFARLPHTATEAVAVDSVLDAAGFTVRSITGFNATKAALYEQLPSRFNVVHIATHGVVDPDRPNLSGLLLTGQNQNALDATDMLTMPEIYDLGLHADLVVLSACDTAVGTRIRGEGPISLARGFVIGGARQVLASLWQIPDRATTDLMQAFYRAWVGGDTPQRALRVAQRTLANGNRWRSPWYWGAFVVVGV